MKLIEDFWIGAREPEEWVPHFLQLIKDVLGIRIDNYRFVKDTQRFPYLYSWSVVGTEKDLEAFRCMFALAQENNK